MLYKERKNVEHEANDEASDSEELRHVTQVDTIELAGLEKEEGSNLESGEWLGGPVQRALFSRLSIPR